MYLFIFIFTKTRIEFHPRVTVNKLLAKLSQKSKILTFFTEFALYFKSNYVKELPYSLIKNDCIIEENAA